MGVGNTPITETETMVALNDKIHRHTLTTLQRTYTSMITLSWIVQRSYLLLTRSIPQLPIYNAPKHNSVFSSFISGYNITIDYNVTFVNSFPTQE